MERRAAIYHRGAGETQAAVGRLRAVASKQGWTVVGTFVDRTGARGPEWAALWRMITGRQADLLAVTSFSTMADNVSEALDEILRLRQAGCDLYVDDAGLDTTSPVDRVLFRVAEALRSVETVAARRPAPRKPSREPAAPPSPTPGQRSLVRAALASGMNPRQVARTLKLPLALVQAARKDEDD